MEHVNLGLVYLGDWTVERLMGTFSNLSFNEKGKSEGKVYMVDLDTLSEAS